MESSSLFAKSKNLFVQTDWSNGLPEDNFLGNANGHMGSGYWAAEQNLAYLEAGGKIASRWEANTWTMNTLIA